MIEKYDVRVGSVLYYWNYFKENFKVSFKIATEYKAQLFSMMLEAVAYFIILLTFGFLFFDQIISIENFGFKEFVLFVFIFNIYTDLVGLFWYGSFASLDTQIKTGDFSNFILIRPMSPFLGFLFMRRINSIPFIVIDSILYIPLIIFYFSFDILSVLLSLLLFIFFILFGVIFIRFLESFCWIFLEARKILLYQLYLQGVQQNVGRFPMMMFDRNPTLMIFLGGFGFYYISMWILPLLITGSFQVRTYEVVMIFVVTVISSIIIYINWKIGLKKYAAFS